MLSHMAFLKKSDHNFPREGYLLGTIVTHCDKTRAKPLGKITRSREKT